MSKLSNKEFKPIDGRVLKVEDYFVQDDFVEDNGFFVRHDALLRVCKQLFLIEYRNSHIHQSPNATNGMVAAASVSYSLKQIVNGRINKNYSFTWESCADCGPHNSPKGVEIYPTAIAETRASGRALRFLLGVEFCTKEEIGVRGSSPSVGGDESITSNQRDLLERKFIKQQGITLVQMRKILKMSEEEMPNVGILTKEQASKLITGLNRNVDKLVEQNKEK